MPSPFASIPVAFDETALARSLTNEPGQTAALLVRMDRLARDCSAATMSGNWTRVAHLARRIEAIAYRARLDADRHAMTDELAALAHP